MSEKVTRDQVAKAVGVSPSTVTRALNHHPGIPEKTRLKIQKASLELGYIPSQLSRSHYQNRSFRLGFVIPFSREGEQVETLPKEYFSKVLMGATNSALNQRYSITLTPDENLSADDLIKMVKEKSVDGFIIVGGKTGDSRYAALLEQEVPFILIHNYERSLDVLYVDIDPEQGIHEALVYLRKKGISKVAYLGAGDDFINSQDRELAIINGCRKLNLSCTKIVQSRGWSREEAYKSCEKFIGASMPEVIFCANDRMAFGVIQKMQVLGKKVPDDIRVVGFDHQDIATLVSPKISTIENPFFSIGQKSAELLIAKLNGEEVKSVSIRSRFISYESA